MRTGIYKGKGHSALRAIVNISLRTMDKINTGEGGAIPLGGDVEDIENRQKISKRIITNKIKEEILKRGKDA